MKTLRHSMFSQLKGQELYGSNTLYHNLLRKQIHQHNDFKNTDLKGHFGCVNAIEFTWGDGQYLASGGDDRRILFWNLEKSLKYQKLPTIMIGQHNSNIFCIGFDHSNRKIFSGGNDEQVLINDIETRKLLDVYLHDDVVYGISTDPTNDHVFASACDDGSAVIYDIRLPNSDAFILAKYQSPMHSIMYNPVEPRLLATANAKEGIGLWDVRKPKIPVLRYGTIVEQSCMSVRISQSGERIIAIRRRLPLVLYDIKERIPLCEFDHQGYYNSCTMKSCSFAGDNDEYVLSGSDDFNLYMWRIPDDLSSRAYIDSPHSILRGHRSIVNQVRSNPTNNTIISSGVEKVIKVWKPHEPEVSVGSHYERTLYSHEEYINLILHSGQGMSHDYSQRSVEEEPRMMAFFDSLVQREIEGWSSDDPMSSNDEELFHRILQVSQSDSESTQSTNSEADRDRLSPFSRGFVTVMASRSLAENTPEGLLLQGHTEMLLNDTHLQNDINNTTGTATIRNSESQSNSATAECVSSTTDINSEPLLPSIEVNSTTVSSTCTVNSERKEKHLTKESDYEDLSTVSIDANAICSTVEDVINAVMNSVDIIKLDNTDSVLNGQSSVHSSENKVKSSKSSRDLNVVNKKLKNSQPTSVPISLSRNTTVVNRGTEEDTITMREVSPECDSDNNTVSTTEIMQSTRPVIIDIAGADLSIVPHRVAPPDCRRHISQLIAWRRSNCSKPAKLKMRLISSSSESSDNETSVNSVRAKVLNQSRKIKKQCERDNVDNEIATFSKSTRAMVAYSSDDNCDFDSKTNSYNESNSPSSTAIGTMFKKSKRTSAACTQVSNNVNNSSNCDIDINTDPIRTCDQLNSSNASMHVQNMLNDCTISAVDVTVLDTATSCTHAMINDCKATTSMPTCSNINRDTHNNDLGESSNSHISSTVNLTYGYSNPVNLSLPEQSGENSQPMWTEFKRFKNRMKRAERYYRKHAKKSKKHSSEEENEYDSND